MVPRIAINGFGRIGRTVMRIAKLRGHYDVVAVNDLATADQLAYAFKYDSIHGVYPGEVRGEGTRMQIDGDPFEVLSEPDPANLPWKELGVDYVVESSGRFRRIADLSKHLHSGARRVIVTVPTKEPLDATLVMGVNDHVVTPAVHVFSDAQETSSRIFFQCENERFAFDLDFFSLKRVLIDRRLGRTGAVRTMPVRRWTFV